MVDFCQPPCPASLPAIPRLGRERAEAHPTAKSLFAEADEALGYGLSEICFSGPEEELVRTEHAQPAIYLVGWIALQLLREQSSSLAFAATAGLSLGEFTALAAAALRRGGSMRSAAS